LLDEFVLFHDRPEIEAEKIPTTTTGSSNVLSTATKSSVTPSGRKAAPVYPTVFVQLKVRYFFSLTFYFFPATIWSF
jgi:hypothetical protein